MMLITIDFSGNNLKETDRKNPFAISTSDKLLPEEIYGPG